MTAQSLEELVVTPGRFASKDMLENPEKYAKHRFSVGEIVLIGGVLLPTVIVQPAEKEKKREKPKDQHPTQYNPLYL